jgi:hypothetical protein
MPTPSSNLGLIDLGLKSLLLNKFASVMGIEAKDENIVLYPKEIALREVAEKRGANSVGFISFYPSGIGVDSERKRTPVATRGIPTIYTSNAQSRMNVVKAVPVKLAFEIVFWSLSLDKLLAIAEEYLFWQYNSPTLDMSFNNVPLNFQIIGFNDLIDESTLREKYSKGTIFVYSTQIMIDGWLPRFELDWTVKTIYTTVYDNNAFPPIKIFSRTDTESGGTITFQG